MHSGTKEIFCMISMQQEYTKKGVLSLDKSVWKG